MSELSARHRHVHTPHIAQPGEEHIAILLATYNGGDMLGDQLKSLLRQTHKDWSLVVSDDGSSDQTLGVICDFAARNPDKQITLRRGPALGSSQNFLSLLRAAGSAQFVAFCDQDDVWFDDKLARAMGQLRQTTEPAIYGSTTIITDKDLKPLRRSVHFKRPTGFRNALVQNVAGGNTMVINRLALNVLQPASRHATQVTSHDWWCYQMVTGMGGRMIYDPVPGLYYRQHGANQIGANDSFGARISRLRRLACGDFSISLHAHFEALARAQEWFTPGARHALAKCLHLGSENAQMRFRALLKSGVYRQTPCGTLALRIAALTGRL